MDTIEIIHGLRATYCHLKCRCDKCKAANNKYLQEWRDANKERSCAIKTKSYRTKSQTLDDIKTSSGCIECGFNDHPAALHFDHVRGEKLFSIANQRNNYSLERLLIEIEKCEVVCANHHAIRTYERGQHISRGPNKYVK